jgi:uncharacterized Zn-binding protein involved in type VI secretion
MVPIPLPSIGMVMIGMSLQVTMGGLPAARAGDIGLAMSCCGLVPLFSITTGSSKVFVGGMRAARASDIAQACAPGTPGMQAMATVMLGLGVIAQGAGAVADAQESADAPDANVAAALALSATMGAMQAAMDATSAAAGALMGTDPALPPLPGALLPSGASVMVAGMPTPNFPNPLEALIHAVRNRRARRRGENGGETHAGCHACP